MDAIRELKHEIGELKDVVSELKHEVISMKESIDEIQDTLQNSAASSSTALALLPHTNLGNQVQGSGTENVVQNNLRTEMK